MAIPIPETPILNEERWQAWVEQGKRADRASARKQRWGAMLVPVALVALAIYLMR